MFGKQTGHILSVRDHAGNALARQPVTSTDAALVNGPATAPTGRPSQTACEAVLSAGPISGLDHHQTSDTAASTRLRCRNLNRLGATLSVASLISTPSLSVRASSSGSVR